MTRLCDQVLFDFLHCLKRTAHFLHQRNLACTEAFLYELHQEVQKTLKVFWGLSRLFHYAQIRTASQFNRYLHSYLFMVCEIAYYRSWKCPGFIMAGPTDSFLDSPSLSIFNKHLNFSFSQNEHNVYYFLTRLLHRMHFKGSIIIPYLLTYC